MNIVEFRNRMKNPTDYTSVEASYILDIASRNGDRAEKSMIVMEECAELQDVIINSFYNRKINDAQMHVVEELADVCIGLEYLKRLYETKDYQLYNRPTCFYRNDRYLTQKDIALAARELSLLQQAISKCVRGHDDAVIELHTRMVKVYTKVLFLRWGMGISKEMLKNAINVKLSREVVRNSIDMKGVKNARLYNLHQKKNYEVPIIGALLQCKNKTGMDSKT